MEENTEILGPENQETSYPTFLIDWRKIQSVEDVRKIFKYMTLQFTPSSDEDLEEMKHLIVPTNLEEEYIKENHS